MRRRSPPIKRFAENLSHQGAYNSWYLNRGSRALEPLPDHTLDDITSVKAYRTVLSSCMSLGNVGSCWVVDLGLRFEI